ncbi:uncharacterized protein VTP21DRAFT_2016 [Calcarisporiella thermophila]|uniref:uncharacterized protein n=1 Tax=Calcarisporiella thermophila TaxID=911321 RepID=UPI003743C3E2
MGNTLASPKRREEWRRQFSDRKTQTFFRRSAVPLGRADSADTQFSPVHGQTVLSDPFPRRQGHLISKNKLDPLEILDSPYIKTYIISEKEIERQDKMHMMLHWGFQRNHMAPVEKMLRRGAKCLDIGCGSASWTIEMASEYPQSEFIGIDIIEITFPLDRELPHNLTLELRNALDPLPYADGEISYVFQRLALLSYPLDDWPRVMSEIKRVTKPGGYVELVEVDTYPEKRGPLFTRYLDAIHAVAREDGVDLNMARRLTDIMDEAGFEEVKAHRLTIPMHESHGRLGRLCKEVAMDAFRSMGKVAQQRMGMTSEEYTQFFEVDMSNEIETYETMAFFNCVYGRVPGGPVTDATEEDRDGGKRAGKVGLGGRVSVEEDETFDEGIASMGPTFPDNVQQDM